jgi:hypothetical protein
MTYDDCYAGVNADGSMILQPDFVASIRRFYEARDASRGVARAIDAALDPPPEDYGHEIRNDQLNRAYAAMRGQPQGKGDKVDWAGQPAPHQEQDAVRARYRITHGMGAATDSQVDRCLALNAAYAARRGKDDRWGGN